MKNGRTLVELAQEVERQHDQKHDYLAGTELLDTHPIATEDGTKLGMTIEGAQGNGEFEVNEIANQQIGTTLGIPAKYYDKMLGEYPELLAENINGWFKRDPSNRMVRTLDGTVRAFLSERYRRIDNDEILETVLPILEQLHDSDDVRIESCEVTERKLYLKVVNPRLQAEVTPGDIVQSGILITNSEVGLGSVSVMPLIYRLVCTNGMVVNDAGTRKYHVGRGNEADDNLEIFADDTRKADDEAFMLKLRDIVTAVTEQTRFDRVVNIMRSAKGARITTPNIPKLVELTAKEFLVNKEESSSVLDKLIRGSDLSLYGLANAVTAQAQEVKSYDRSTELEGVGYDIMSMNNKHWQELNANSTAMVPAVA